MTELVDRRGAIGTGGGRLGREVLGLSDEVLDKSRELLEGAGVVRGLLLAISLCKGIGLSMVAADTTALVLGTVFTIGAGGRRSLLLRDASRAASGPAVVMFTGALVRHG